MLNTTRRRVAFPHSSLLERFLLPPGRAVTLLCRGVVECPRIRVED